MANYIEFTNIPASRFVPVSSRYIDSSVVYYTDKKLLTFETYKKPTFTPSLDDRFMVVPKGQEYRPDLTSRKFYGTPDFWWKILLVNDIKDVFDYKAGINIRIPKNLL